MKTRKRIYAISVIFALIAPLFVSMPSAQAAPVTATGTNPSVCNQDVGNASNVVAYRLSGGDCVIEFKNVGSTTWTVPGGVTSVSLLVVGGGGGGGSRHAGGGGGGGVVYAEYFPVSGTVGIAVGGGGTGGASAIGGTSGSDSRLFANSEATAGSTGIIAKGGGFGDFYQFTSGNKFIGRAGDGGSGGGTAVPNPFTRDLGSSPWGNTDPRGYTIQSSQTQKNLIGNALTSNVWQYGSNGAQGGNQDYWAGGGGGGAGGEGSRGGGAAGTNNQGGAGGAGVANSITDSSLSYGCGGGGGGGISGGVAQSGGAGGTGCGGGGGSTGNAAATNGTANRGGGGGGGGLAVNGTNGAGGAGGAGIVIVRYTPDTTAPTFTSSSSFSAAENIATSATAATIRVSESATVTISSGADQTLFNIARSETNTALITFKTSPNFEAPADSGGNNVYDLTLTATDSAGNAGTQAITISVTNVVEIPAITALPTISGITTFGQVLTAGNGSWSESPTAYTYQWSRSATSGGAYTSISGATSSTYTLVTADVDQYLRVRVLAANSAGSTPETSTATAQIARASQTITFSSLGTSSKTYPYSQALSMSTSGSSGSGGITYAIVAGGGASSCTLSNSSASATITATTSGTCLIAATIAQDANYTSATSSNLTFTFSKASQSAITITTTTASYGSNLTLTSTGGSTGGSYSYSKVSGNCTLSGAVLTPTATGSCIVQSSLATDANYLAETSTATTITISSGFVSASLTIAPGNLTFRQAKNITAVATVAGKITFRVAGKILPGCKNKVVNAGNSFTTTCSYRPSNHSYVTISATLDPTDSFYVGTVTSSAQYLVTRRVGAR